VFGTGVALDLCDFTHVKRPRQRLWFMTESAVYLGGCTSSFTCSHDELVILPNSRWGQNLNFGGLASPFAARWLRACKEIWSRE